VWHLLESQPSLQGPIGWQSQLWVLAADTNGPILAESQNRPWQPTRSSVALMPRTISRRLIELSTPAATFRSHYDGGQQQLPLQYIVKSLHTQHLEACSICTCQ
jgi:hypothetical protein